jgi:hypothetical protein
MKMDGSCTAFVLVKDVVTRGNSLARSLIRIRDELPTISSLDVLPINLPDAHGRTGTLTVDTRHPEVELAHLVGD